MLKAPCLLLMIYSCILHAILTRIFQNCRIYGLIFAINSWKYCWYSKFDISYWNIFFSWIFISTNSKSTKCYTYSWFVTFFCRSSEGNFKFDILYRIFLVFNSGMIIVLSWIIWTGINDTAIFFSSFLSFLYSLSNL